MSAVPSIPPLLGHEKELQTALGILDGAKKNEGLSFTQLLHELQTRGVSDPAQVACATINHETVDKFWVGTDVRYRLRKETGHAPHDRVERGSEAATPPA